MSESESLWCKVLHSKYNFFAGNLSDARSGRASSWWKDIVISCCDPHDSCWFDKSISRQIRAGNSVRFWHDSWLGDDSLVTFLDFCSTESSG